MRKSFKRTNKETGQSTILDFGQTTEQFIIDNINYAGDEYKLTIQEALSDMSTVFDTHSMLLDLESEEGELDGGDYTYTVCKMGTELKKVIKSMHELLEVWDESEVKNYPSYLPSFDEFISDLDEMLEEEESIPFITEHTLGTHYRISEGYLEYQPMMADQSGPNEDDWGAVDIEMVGDESCTFRGEEMTLAEAYKVIIKELDVLNSN